MFFKPSSIAVVGASSDPSKGGNMILTNIARSWGTNRLYPVNPRGEEIMGMRVYKSLEDIPEEQIDLVILFIPSRFIIQVLEQCVKKEVRGVIIESAGFAEVGKEGKKIQDDMVRISKTSGMRIWGGNCMAFIMKGLITTFLVIDKVTEGNLSIVGQSGYFSGAVYEYLVTERDLNIRKACSIGNKTDVDECDLIIDFDKDPGTKVAAFYLESFKDGRKFVELAKDVSKRMPVICLPGAMSETGRQAAASHTGALITRTPSKLFKSVLTNAGVILAESFKELFDLSEAFSRLPVPEGRNLAVITITGAGGVVACDVAEKYGLNIVKLPVEAEKRLKTVFPSWMPPRNPVDAWPAFEKSGLMNALDTMLDCILAEKDVHMLIVMMASIKVAYDFDPAIIGKYINKYNKPIVTCITGEKKLTERWVKVIREGNAVNFDSIDSCIGILAKMAEYRNFLGDLF